ncbi:hypothetical protein I4U23_023616 [Adineta vaga]|nr:hypothetical protein I4U23_023616 [Adineta vaga]
MPCSKMILFKAIGISYFVLASYHEPSFICIPIQSFLVAYFFFIVGYNFKPFYSLWSKIRFIKDKAEQYILMYFVYNILFALLRTFINLYLETTILGPYPTLYNFFLEPIFQSRLYPLSGSTWFYPQLFLTIVIVQFIYYNKTENIYIDGMYIISSTSLFAIGIHQFEVRNYFQILFIRITFSLIFTFLGYIYHQYFESNKEKLFFTSFYCFLAFALLSWILYFYPNVRFNYVKADFQQQPFWIPIILGCIHIYIHLFLSYTLQDILDENDILNTIAKESYHIMFLHGLSFTLINLFVFKCLLKMDNQIFEMSFRYKPDLTWPFYFAGGIQIPILFIKCVRFVKMKWFPFLFSFL